MRQRAKREKVATTVAQPARAPSALGWAGYLQGFVEERGLSPLRADLRWTICGPRRHIALWLAARSCPVDVDQEKRIGTRSSRSGPAVSPKLKE
jgi:hypothetical protein